MKSIVLSTFLFLISAIPLSSQIPTAQKLIVIVADDWDSRSARMMLFDRARESWKKQRMEFTVSIGANGLGWGVGLHPEQPGNIQKQEGDQRSPAGIFLLDSLFYGIDPVAPAGIRYGYRPMTSLTRCVDDTGSALYAGIVEEGMVEKDWNSAERMGKIYPDYKYLLVIRHNPERIKGLGSCIFIHINNTATSGCTAMDEEDMISLLHWLDPKRKTLVVQLPHAEYHRLRSEWQLPVLLSR